METSTKYSLRRRTAMCRIITVLALATAFSGLSTLSASAADHDRGRHDNRGRHDGRRSDYRGYVFQHPQGYYLAPPPVYAIQPSPPPPALEFVFPLHIR